MHRQRITRRRRPGPGADLLHVARPRDREGLRPPHAFEQGAIGPLRGAIDCAGNIGQPHFHRVGRRPLCLLGRRIAQPPTGRTHIPEITADEVTPPRIVMQYGR